MTSQIIGFILALVIVVGGSFYLIQSGSLALVKQTFTFHLSTSTFSYAPNSTSTAPAPTPPSYAPPRASPPSPSKTSGGNLGGQAPSPPAIDPSQIPKGFTAKDLSPHFRRIRINSAYAGSGSGTGRISLYVSLDKGEQVDITGWQFKANHGGTFIPGGIALYHPSGNSPESDIFVQNGDYIYFYSASKLNRKNVRLNRCMGYLNSTAASGYGSEFPNNCPHPDRSELRGFSGQCQDYILSIGTCREPSSNPPLSVYDYACRSYLDTLNYNGCFNKHLQDADFLSHEWRVWMGGDILDSRHDDLRLLDNQGLLVDVYSY